MSVAQTGRFICCVTPPPRAGLGRDTTQGFIGSDAAIASVPGGSAAPPSSPSPLLSWGCAVALTMSIPVGTRLVFRPEHCRAVDGLRHPSWAAGPDE